MKAALSLVFRLSHRRGAAKWQSQQRALLRPQCSIRTWDWTWRLSCRLRTSRSTVLADEVVLYLPPSSSARNPRGIRTATCQPAPQANCSLLACRRQRPPSRSPSAGAMRRPIAAPMWWSSWSTPAPRTSSPSAPAARTLGSPAPPSGPRAITRSPWGPSSPPSRPGTASRPWWPRTSPAPPSSTSTRPRSRTGTFSPAWRSGMTPSPPSNPAG